MNIIVHYPTTKAGQDQLAQKVAECHAQVIIEQIRRMNISNEDRKKLISLMCEKLKENKCHEPNLSEPKITQNEPEEDAADEFQIGFS